jgi:hypothetical protein
MHSVKVNFMKTPNTNNGRGDSAAQHTPGPWEVFPAYTGTSRFPVGINHGDGSSSIFAEVNGRGGVDGQNMADARLIAAAPDLLAALQRALPLIEKCERESGSGLGELYAKAARVAIAKAEGRAE